MPQSLPFVKQARLFVLHFVFVFLSVIGILFIIAPSGGNRVYNVNYRRPHFIDANGSPRVASIHNAKLLQSDITTILSLLTSATRAAAAWWAGSLLWRCAFMFMEKSEITYAGFSKIMSGGITTPISPRHVSSLKNWLLIYAIIFTCVVMDYFSAILTGSVTWQPSFTLVDGVVPLSNLPEGIPGTDISSYREQPLYVLQAIEVAASLAQVSWGVFNTDSSGLSLPSNLTRRAIIQGTNITVQHLGTNSTLDTIRLPYFNVENFEYITDPASTLTSQQRSLLNDSSSYNPFLLGNGWVGFFPDASWGPGNSTTLPSPVKSFSESRILAFQFMTSASSQCPPVSTFYLPENIIPYSTFIVNAPFYSCFVFANVTYTAGATICHNCGISSPTVVQGNISDLQPTSDPLTLEALSIAPSVATRMFVASVGDDTLDSYLSTPLKALAIESVSRAYQSAWSSLVNELGDYGQDNNQTGVQVAVPASHPNVLRWRVYLWAGLHLAVLLGGIAFVFLQSRFRHPWAADPVTAAFLLDTTAIFNLQGKAANSDAMDPWDPNAEHPAGKLKLNDYDPSRPGRPRTVVLVPTRSIYHSGYQQVDSESDIFLTRFR